MRAAHRLDRGPGALAGRAVAVGRQDQAANHFAGRWEATHRPALLHRWTPETALTDSTASTPLRTDELAALADGPTLLLVHGTFSTARGGFGALPAVTGAELVSRYAGRVVAWEHQLAAVGAPLTLDVVTHSRGGLVGRALAERGAELRPTPGRPWPTRRTSRRCWTG